MDAAPTTVFAREDTLLGICQALGEDFGFNPTWLRVALAAGLLWNPSAMIAAYAALGALVLLSRLLVPNPRRVDPARPAASEAPAAAADEPLAIAA
jgi:phage shock protein C